MLSVGPISRGPGFFCLGSGAVWRALVGLPPGPWSPDLLAPSPLVSWSPVVTWCPGPLVLGPWSPGPLIPLACDGLALALAWLGLAWAWLGWRRLGVAVAWLGLARFGLARWLSAKACAPLVL